MMNGKKWPQRMPLLLAVLVLSVTGCSPVQTRWLPTPEAAIPPLPAGARQGPSPSICSPTCSDALSNDLSSWLPSPTAPAPRD
ncbi:hypothetical protein RAN3_2560 [plant metagenome]|uniref:Uncharacterized protein n=1 Tax=plant metagenome TaxID=1297885 RepID=A0A484U5S1_9ZZZZ